MVLNSCSAATKTPLAQLAKTCANMIAIISKDFERALKKG
jgi:hypothetical protein